MNVIDTNIWLYSHDARDPLKQSLAQQLIATVRPLALPWQVGCEFVAASRKLAAGRLYRNASLDGAGSDAGPGRRYLASSP